MRDRVQEYRQQHDERSPGEYRGKGEDAGRDRTAAKAQRVRDRVEDGEHEQRPSRLGTRAVVA